MKLSSHAAASRAVRRSLATASVALAVACAQRIAPLTGVAPAVQRLPDVALPASPQRITFHWELNDNSMVARGDGVARLEPPDSARVDLFLGGGFGGASAILVGDSLRTPPGASGVSLVPPAPLLWAALGRLALPPVPDTIVRVSGDTLRASLGSPVRWRMTAVGGQLTRVERVEGDRIVEWVERDPGRRVYYQLSGGRSLVLTIEGQQPAPPFDASIWRF